MIDAGGGGKFSMNMDNQLLMAIVPVVSIVVGWGLSSLTQRWHRGQMIEHEKWKQEQKREDEKWKEKQQRVNMFLEKRLTAYSEGLEFVYQVEKSQTNADVLQLILDRWEKWYPLNVVYLPPVVNNDLFGAMGRTAVIRIDLNNRDKDRETWRIFKEKLQAAKESLMNLRDIGWLPNDLR